MSGVYKDLWGIIWGICKEASLPDKKIHGSNQQRQMVLQATMSYKLRKRAASIDPIDYHHQVLGPECHDNSTLEGRGDIVSR